VLGLVARQLHDLVSRIQSRREEAVHGDGL
jgi:hypothetical protein